MRTIRTKVVGVTARNDDGERRQDLIEDLKTGQELELIRDRYNEHDENAIEVHDREWGQIGFIKRDLAYELADLMDEGVPVEGSILQVTGGDGRSYGVNIELRVYDGDEAEDLERRQKAQEDRQRRTAEYAGRQATVARQEPGDDHTALITVGVVVIVAILLMLFIL